MENTNSSRSTAFRNMMHQRTQQVKSEKNQNKYIQTEFVKVFAAIKKAKENIRNDKSNLDEVFNKLEGEVAQIADELTHFESEEDIER